MEFEFIKETSSWDSGGGITLDLIELKDGRVLAISDDAVVLYKDMDELMEGTPSPQRPFIALA